MISRGAICWFIIIYFLDVWFDLNLSMNWIIVVTEESGSGSSWSSLCISAFKRFLYFCCSIRSSDFLWMWRSLNSYWEPLLLSRIVLNLSGDADYLMSVSSLYRLMILPPSFRITGDRLSFFLIWMLAYISRYFPRVSLRSCWGYERVCNTLRFSHMSFLSLVLVETTGEYSEDLG